MSYPRPHTAPHSKYPLKARPLLPLQPPPHAEKPPLPSPARRSLLDASGFALTTHLVPAAFPRTTPVVSRPALPEWSPDKTQFQKAAASAAAEVMSTKHKQRRGELHEPPNRNPLWVCLNRYLGRDTSRSGCARSNITLFFSHANGFPKEVRGIVTPPVVLVLMA